MEKKRLSLRDMIAVGLMAALVFVFTYLHIDIPTPLSNTMLHLGNVMSLLAAMLFGGVRGGLAAGLGSMIYDMLDPRYLPTCWLTFIMKFLMGYVAGKMCEKLKTRNPLTTGLAAFTGSVVYVLLYMAKTYITNRFVYGYEKETVWITTLTKGGASFLNGVIAAVCSALLYTALTPALRGAGLLDGKKQEKEERE